MDNCAKTKRIDRQITKRLTELLLGAKRTRLCLMMTEWDKWGRHNDTHIHTLNRLSYFNVLLDQWRRHIDTHINTINYDILIFHWTSGVDKSTHTYTQ